MGPRARYLGPDVPAEALLWQDPVPAAEGKPVDAADIDGLKGKIRAAGLSDAELVKTAWASAASFRGTDKRGGAHADQDPVGLQCRRQEGLAGRPDRVGRQRRHRGRGEEGRL